MRFHLILDTIKKRYYIIDLKTNMTYEKQENFLVDQQTGAFKKIDTSSNDYIELVNILLEKQFDLLVSSMTCKR